MIDQFLRKVCIHTSATNAYERRPYPHLPLAQLLWWRRHIVFNPDIFLAVISCCSHLAMLLERTRRLKGRLCKIP
jgi:hypothetical protein